MEKSEDSFCFLLFYNLQVFSEVFSVEAIYLSSEPYQLATRRCVCLVRPHSDHLTPAGWPATWPPSQTCQPCRPKFIPFIHKHTAPLKVWRLSGELACQDEWQMPVTVLWCLYYKFFTVSLRISWVLHRLFFLTRQLVLILIQFHFMPSMYLSWCRCYWFQWYKYR